MNALPKLNVVILSKMSKFIDSYCCMCRGWNELLYVVCCSQKTRSGLTGRAWDHQSMTSVQTVCVSSTPCLVLDCEQAVSFLFFFYHRFYFTLYPLFLCSGTQRIELDRLRALFSSPPLVPVKAARASSVSFRSFQQQHVKLNGYKQQAH